MRLPIWVFALLLFFAAGGVMMWIDKFVKLPHFGAN